uniref:Uncharacterized protein n=1 Tax=Chromera velia CCMP2878 TaxID=1169474 RepID=A0A0G4IFF1_9ALVE|eukprot:Cvel_13874.t1-p1 / transcript=Cvel_13874.t1 / gene=Cvel_13874 / organism=Chromera_velia_CCMP2878 / gene_product=hypothetical protein / transcript_product=hypothetical protein / location=Cvel_scaffold965:20574-21242(-) / protein_length=223 / sequence_SO=supercontig / SO=protein_coding / is_pseudo=false
MSLSSRLRPIEHRRVLSSPPSPFSAAIVSLQQTGFRSREPVIPCTKTQCRFSSTRKQNVPSADLKSKVSFPLEWLAWSPEDVVREIGDKIPGWTEEDSEVIVKHNIQGQCLPFLQESVLVSLGMRYGSAILLCKDFRAHFLKDDPVFGDLTYAVSLASPVGQLTMTGANRRAVEYGQDEVAKKWFSWAHSQYSSMADSLGSAGSAAGSAAASFFRGFTHHGKK